MSDLVIDAMVDAFIDAETAIYGHPGSGQIDDGYRARVAVALQAALEAAPAVTEDGDDRPVWACDCNVDHHQWHTDTRDWCESHDCPGPHRTLLVGPPVDNGDDL